jgi:hypothetical protein
MTRRTQSAKEYGMKKEKKREKIQENRLLLGSD